MLRIGIVGAPGSGKTSLFKALTPSTGVEVGARGKREIHIGQAKVQDPRLDELTRIFHPERKVNAIVEYVDMAGFTKGEASRSGFEAQFLGEIRTCEALLHVVRSFPYPGLPEADPLRDYSIDLQEFILSDHIILEKRLERLKKDTMKNPRPDAAKEIELLDRCLVALAEEKPLRTLQLSLIESMLLKSYQPLTLKPDLIVVNVAETQVSEVEAVAAKYRPTLEGTGSQVVAACSMIEMEIAELDESSAREFMDDLGIETSALDRLVTASYQLLGLISFFTVGDDEVRAWTIPAGTNARSAAGAVHSDMERGFIRADVVGYVDFIARGNLAACRKDGVQRLEGKDYIVKDGDIIEVRFAV
ncbi:MAG: redox-regulated ATPase YchF [bacterium]|nr:redox-regulated ATPase YchF [bacterium]